MAASVEKVPGISIDVGDLIDVKNRLGDIFGTRSWRQSSLHAGSREIHLRGRGMEYAESRAYVHGDDMRTMDWRVMARTGEAHTKIFAEEKDRFCLLATDLSASMFFGTRGAFKSWAAAQAAAHAGWLASFAGERIGGLVVAPAYHGVTRPGKTRSGLLGVFHQLARAAEPASKPPNRASRLGFLLGELKRVTRPGANITLISDFLELDESVSQALADITRHNRVSAYWIYDEIETDEWPEAHYPVLSGGRSHLLDLTDSNRRAWLRQLQLQHRQRVTALCQNFGIALLPLCCNRDITAQFVHSRLS